MAATLRGPAEKSNPVIGPSERADQRKGVAQGTKVHVHGVRDRRSGGSLVFQSQRTVANGVLNSFVA